MRKVGVRKDLPLFSENCALWQIHAFKLRLQPPEIV
jgi:hypothetical protein